MNKFRCADPIDSRHLSVVHAHNSVSYRRCFQLGVWSVRRERQYEYFLNESDIRNTIIGSHQSIRSLSRRLDLPRRDIKFFRSLMEATKHG